MMIKLKNALERLMIQRRYTLMMNEIRSKKIVSNNEKKYLDIGCGLGIDLMRRAAQGFDVIGLDINFQSLFSMHCHTKYVEWHLLCASGLSLPLTIKTVDIVQCRHVIEHIRDDSKTMLEINRVLKWNGLLYIGVPNIDNLMTKAKLALRFKQPYTDQTHIREYNRNQIVDLVRNAGFRIIKCSYSGFMPPFPFPFVQHVWVFLKFFLPRFSNTLNWFAMIFPQFAASIDIIAVKARNIHGKTSHKSEY